MGNGQQEVDLNGKTLLNWLYIDSDVLQGTVGDPTLFLLFINDLHINCNNIPVRHFADDCLLFRRVNNKSDSDLL